MPSPINKLRINTTESIKKNKRYVFFPIKLKYLSYSFAIVKLLYPYQSDYTINSYSRYTKRLWTTVVFICTIYFFCFQSMKSIRFLWTISLIVFVLYFFYWILLSLELVKPTTNYFSFFKYNSFLHFTYAVHWFHWYNTEKWSTFFFWIDRSFFIFLHSESWVL